MIFAVNYDTWRWNDFVLEELQEGAVVLTLVEGCYWEKRTKLADDVWAVDDPDGEYFDSTELEEFILEEVGPEEHVVIAPNGLMSSNEAGNACKDY